MAYYPGFMDKHYTFINNLLNSFFFEAVILSFNLELNYHIQFQIWSYTCRISFPIWPDNAMVVFNINSCPGLCNQGYFTWDLYSCKYVSWRNADKGDGEI